MLPVPLLPVSDIPSTSKSTEAFPPVTEIGFPSQPVVNISDVLDEDGPSPVADSALLALSDTPLLLLQHAQDDVRVGLLKRPSDSPRILSESRPTPSLLSREVLTKKFDGIWCPNASLDSRSFSPKMG